MQAGAAMRPRMGTPARAPGYLRPAAAAAAPQRLLRRAGLPVAAASAGEAVPRSPLVTRDGPNTEASAGVLKLWRSCNAVCFDVDCETPVEGDLRRGQGGRTRAGRPVGWGAGGEVAGRGTQAFACARRNALARATRSHVRRHHHCERLVGPARRVHGRGRGGGGGDQQGALGAAWGRAARAWCCMQVGTELLCTHASGPAAAQRARPRCTGRARCARRCALAGPHALGPPALQCPLRTRHLPASAPAQPRRVYAMSATPCITRAHACAMRAHARAAHPHFVPRPWTAP